MAKQDFYELLGVARMGARPTRSRRPIASSPCSITRTAIRATRQPSSRFKEINEAYDVLKDEQKRAAYDRFGHAAFEQGGGAAGDFGFGGSGGFADIFDEMFGEFMGGGGGGQARTIAAATCATISRSRSRKPSAASRRRSACRRSRRAMPARAAAPKPGSKPIDCPTCHGAGRVRAQQGFFTIERTCPACQGAGKRHREAVPRLRRPRPHAQGEDARRSTSRPASRTARASASPARARPACAAAGRGDLYIFLAVNAASRCSSATAPTSIAACRSR